APRRRRGAPVALRGGLLTAMRKLSILLSLLAVAAAAAPPPPVSPSPGGRVGDGRGGQGVRGPGWTMFRGDPQQTGRAAGDLPADLAPLWTFRIEKGISSTAAIADGAVYVGGLD